MGRINKSEWSIRAEDEVIGTWTPLQSDGKSARVEWEWNGYWRRLWVLKSCIAGNSGVRCRLLYLDHNATTAVQPEVREAMLPYLGDEWGNPSSSYRFGSKLKSKIETAREQVTELVGAKATREILFTSGGTESNNTAIHAAIMSRPEKRHLITSQVEHSSVLAYCQYLERYRDFRVTYLPVDREGLLSTVDLEIAITADTALVSLMWANNETGVLFPVEKIGALCHSRDVLFHCDAVQAVGKLPMKVKDLPIDYLSLTGRNGHPTLRLPNTTSVTFHSIEFEALLLLLDQAGICASSGSACLGDSPDPSHVIAAMKPGVAARQSVRFSLGLDASTQSIHETLNQLASIARSLIRT